MLSAAALKKRLLERQAASSASSASPEGSGKPIEDGIKGSGGSPGPGDKVSGAFERLLLEGAEIPAGGDGYVQHRVIFKSRDKTPALTASKVCRPRSLLRSLPGERWSSSHPLSLQKATSRSRRTVFLSSTSQMERYDDPGSQPS